MSKRMNVAKGGRWCLVLEAGLHYVETHSKANLRQQLKEAALANASLDLEIATEWFPVEQEAWQILERAERVTKPSRSTGKSTSPRSIRRSATK